MTQYQICTQCVMDTSDPGIRFDEKGICSHCHSVRKKMNRYPHHLSSEDKKLEFEKLVAQIREDGKNKSYDCIAGVSGGVDSTYLMYRAKQVGLRPLAVHLDNGWNSELAVHNIEKICKTLDIDLFTYIIDWEEFRDIQLSFLRASTPDSEIPTDHAITAILYKTALRHGVKYILSGGNFNTESILPEAWSHGHNDWRYIKSLHKTFGSVPFRTFPYSSYFRLFYYVFIRKIKVIDFLDFIDYDKQEAQRLLKDKLNWQPYKGKHHESLYTRFFQSYILPRKFGFDKRRAHLSSMICAGQMTREQALDELEQPLYTEIELSEDTEYVASKLGLSPDQFQEIMNLPPRTFWDYPSYENSFFYKVARVVYRLLKGKKLSSTPDES